MKIKLDRRTKWSYCIGASGRDASYALVNMFLVLYVQYTMNLSSIQFAVISVGMVGAMVWDAVDDLVMGIIIENTHLRWGKFKPWILIGSILNAVILFCLFAIRPQGWGFVFFYLLFYLLWGMTYTINDIAYWGVLPSLSSDPKTRDSLVTLMSIFISIGQFAVAGFVPIVIAGNAVAVYRQVALIVALVLVASQALTAFGIRERKRETENEHPLSLVDMYHIFARNDQLVVSGVASVLFNMSGNLLLVLGINFFNVEYGYADGGELVTGFTIMYAMGSILAQMCYSTISRLMPRRKIITISFVGMLLSFLCMGLYGYLIPKEVVLLNMIGFLTFFFQGQFNLALLVMMNNTIEYDEYRFGERHDSVVSAVRSFSAKLASGINQGLSALILIFSGIYSTTRQISQLEILSNRGEITNAEVLTQADAFIAQIQPVQHLTFRIFLVGIPIVCLITAYLILRIKYHIDEKEYTRYIRDL